MCGLKITDAIVRVVALRTDTGIEGNGCTTTFAVFDFDRAIAETLCPLLPLLIGVNPLARKTLWQLLRPRTLPVAWGARSAIYIALLDIAGKVARAALYQMLGGARERILSYASMPLLGDVPAYL